MKQDKLGHSRFLKTLTMALLLSPALLQATPFYSQGFDVVTQHSTPSRTTSFTAAKVVLPSSEILGSLRWTGTYTSNTPTTDDFTLRIYADSTVTNFTHLPELTASILDIDIDDNASRSATGEEDGGFDFYAHEYTLATPISLSASTNYWFAIYNKTNDWFWNNKALNPNPDANTVLGARNTGDGTAWTSNDNTRPRLQLTAPVPLPAAVWLFGAGLLSLLGMRRRKAG